MKRFRAYRLSFPLLGACGLLLLTFLSLTPRTARASIESAQRLAERGQRAADRGEMLAAWERARASGSHRFSADVIQRTIPRATVSNVGRQSREDAYHVKGVASLPDQRLEFSLWSEGGSLANGQGSVEVRVEGDQALIRQGTGAWQEVEDFSGLFAPDGDLLAYLSAAQDVVKEGTETRAGLSFTRYTFQLDGRRFAAHMRDQLERQLAEQGDLPPGAHLELPRTYAEMAGQGELWVGEDGLPLRQILDLQFPETDEDRVKARVDITFSDFGEGAPAASGVRQALRLSSHALSQTGVLALVLLFLAGMIACRRSKKLYAAVVVTVVLSLVVTPQLQSARVAAFAGRQASSVQEEKEDRPVNQMQVSRTRTEDPLGSQAPVGADLERLWGTGQLPRTSQAFWAGSTPDRQVEDSGSDSDGDGLTDAQEQLLGTSSATTDWDRDGRPDGWDTDNDRITDTLEAQGFVDANGATWYSDPLVADSNGDGLDDGVEWFSNLTDGVPGDADGDQVPDLYDRDNDGDGVPDDVDLSPYQATLSTAPFSRSDPFALKIEGLVVGRPTYVEFQLRPVVTDHLWYAYNVLDWPLDKQGQMQDQDGTTFAQVRAAENQSVSATAGSAKQDENGDLELVPMLEIVISGAHDNLPPASTLERLYGIFVQDRVADGTEKAVYVPLQLVTETGGGARVAFRGKMLYQPDAAWDAQEVRLVWAVQALVDVCAKYDDSGICSVYSGTNRTQIIQVYYDEWTLTGLDVRENQSYEIGVILEDPAVDDDLDVDDTLTLLTYALDDTFVNGRAGDDGARDLAVGELRRRFDHTLNGDLGRTATITERWGLPNTLRVYAARYTHPDQGVADLATLTDTLPATQPILNAHFTPLVERGQHVTPTLLYVSEEQFRATNLDDAGSTGGWHGDGNRELTVDVSRGSNLTVARQRWQPYCHEGDSWTTCDVADYWAELGRRHRSLFLDEPDPAVAELERVLLQSYYLTLLMGQSGVVGLDGLPVSLLAPAERQLDAALTERLSSLQALGDVRETMIKEIMVHAANTGFGVGSHLLTGGKGLSLQRGLLIMGAEVGALLIGTFLYRFGIDSQALQVTEASLEVTAKVLDKVPEIIELARSLHKIEKVISKGGQGSLKAARLAKTFSKSLKSAAPGFVFELVVIAGFLASQIATTWSGLNHIQRHLMIAETLAEIVIAVLLFILSATVVGAIIAAVIEVIMAVVELLLLIFGESQYSPTNLLTKLLYGYSLIAEPGVDIGRTGMRPDAADPLSGAGIVAGSRLRFTATVTSSATMADPTDWRAVPYIGFWNKNRLRSSTVKTELTSPAPLPDPIPASPGEMVPVWGEPFRDHTYGLVYMYRTETTRTHAVPVPLTAPGLNASLPIYLNVGYAVPYVSCWTPLIPIPICYPDELSGDLSPENIGQSIVVDVLPATLDEFYALYDTGGGYRLAWDARFPVLRDADGDGLLAVAYGGNDPNDARWDADGDGLSDGYELTRRETGGRAASSSPLDDDTDGDGLCDDQEVRLGTYPNQRDSDGDGLADNIEVFHQDRCDGNGNGDRAEWLGGWSFSVVPPEGAAIAAGSVLTTHVTSDPTMADTDGDGLNDRAEYTLGTHPRAPTPSPVALIAEVDDADRVVVPGQSLVYTVTVRNEVRSDVPLHFAGGLTVALPAELGDQVLSAPLDLAVDQGYSMTRRIVVTGASTGPQGTIRASIVNALDGFLNDGDPATYWTFDPPGETVTGDLDPHWSGYPPYASIIPMPGEAPSATYPFGVIGLERPSYGDPAADAQVNLYYADDGGLAAAHPLYDDDRPARRFLGGYPPGAACNRDGVCLVTWERSRYAEWLWYELINVYRWGVSLDRCDGIWGQSGIYEAEFALKAYAKNPWLVQEFELPRGWWWQVDCNESRRLFPTNSLSAWLADPNHPERLEEPCYGLHPDCKFSFPFGGVDLRLKMMEMDGSSVDDVAEVHPGVYYDESRYRSLMDRFFVPDHPTLHYGWAKFWFPIEGVAQVDGRYFAWYRDGVYGALVDPDGNPVGDRLDLHEDPLPALVGTFPDQTYPTDEPIAQDHHGQVAVASDGQDFMTVWAGTWEGSPALSARPVYSDGTMSYPGVHLIAPIGDRDAAAPALVWADGAQRYVAAWYSEGTIFGVLLEPDGTRVGDPIPLAVAGVEPWQQSLDIAYNPAAEQALLVYSNLRDLDDETRIEGVALSVDATGITRGEPSTLGAARGSSLRWPAVAYEPFSGGWWVSWLAPSSDGPTAIYAVALDVRGRPLQQALDAEGRPLEPWERGRVPIAGHRDLSTTLAADGVLQQDLACSHLTTDYASCAWTGVIGETSPRLFFQTVSMDDLSYNVGDIALATTVTVWIDDSGPTVGISLTGGTAYAFHDSVVIGGDAHDPGEMASGVDAVWVSTNGGATWDLAQGAESWAYNWETVPATDGPVTLRVKAVDRLGHEGPTGEVTILLDRTPPESGWTVPEPNIVRAAHDEAGGLWRVPLSGEAGDEGSGVERVRVALTPNGTGWQEAGWDGARWRADYALAPVDTPTGVYTVTVQVEDGAGNAGSPVTFVQALRVDNTPPTLTLSASGVAGGIITQTLARGQAAIRGEIADPGPTASGVGGVEVSIAPAGNLTPTWANALLEDPCPGGAIACGWRYELPPDLEGLYEIRVRGTDALGNRQADVPATRSVVGIDTRPPSAGCTLNRVGSGSTRQTQLEGWAQDLSLDESSFQFDCPPGQVERSYYDDPWYLRVVSDTARLYRLESACTVNGHAASASLSACDRYGRCTSTVCGRMDIYLPIVVRNYTGSSSEWRARSTSQPEAPLAPMSGPASTVLVPGQGSVLTTADPVSLTVGAHAEVGLSALTVSVDGVELDRTSYSCAPGSVVYDTLWTTAWDPPEEEGPYVLLSEAEDCSGQGPGQLVPVTVTLDTRPPEVGLATTVLSTAHGLSYGRVVLRGTASDGAGLAAVQVSDDAGASWRHTSFGDGAWRYAWLLPNALSGAAFDGEPDGVQYPLRVRAVDRAGRMTEVAETVTVDLQPPGPVTVTLSYRSGAGLQVLLPGQTITEADPTLVLEWTPSGDGGGPVTYRAGWRPERSIDPAALSAPGEPYRYTETVSGPQALYAHLAIGDAAGNRRIETVGPVYVDGRGTPDHVSDPSYHGWMEDGCTLIGADREAAHYAPSNAALDDVQKLYASWDDRALRFAWTGADWDSDGDLFLYLDSRAGGASTLYDPYGAGPAIAFPDGLTADFMVWVEDGERASLLEWTGGGWSARETLDAAHYRFEFGSPPVADLLIPFGWLGIDDPGSTQVRWIAVASEEVGPPAGGLRLWAAIPEVNPLNSARAVDVLAHGYQGQAFALTRYVTWDGLGDGLCPNNGHPAGSSLRFSLASEPAGVTAAFLGDDLASTLGPGQWLDEDRDGRPDVALPLDEQSAWVGGGQTVTYTLTYTNAGTAASVPMTVAFAVRGLQLAGDAQLPIGPVAAGDGGTLAVQATVASDVRSAELRVEVADARYGAFEWLWAQHGVDGEPPQNLTIDSPTAYVVPGANLVIGRVLDPAGVAAIELEVTPGGLTSCPGTAPGQRFWYCIWNAPADSAQYEARARATDALGNAGWSPIYRWILDVTPPTVRLSAATEAALADGTLTPGELLLSGTVEDNAEAKSLEFCEGPAGEAPACKWVEVRSGPSPAQAQWQVPATIAGAPDGAPYVYAFQGYDGVGNRSPTLTRTARVDLAGPAIEIEQALETVYQAQVQTILAGAIRDGSGVGSLRVRVTRPDGTVAWSPSLAIDGEAWAYVARLDQVGRHALVLEAWDLHGNARRAGPLYVQVLSSAATADLSVELEASAGPPFGGFAISGLPLTYAARVRNAGPGIAPNARLTLTLPAEVELLEAPGECVQQGRLLTCALRDLAPSGQGRAVSVRVHVPAQAAGTLVCQAFVGSDTVDLNAGNNRQTLFTPLLQPIAGLEAGSDSPTSLGYATTLSATVQTGSQAWYTWDLGDGGRDTGPLVTHVYSATTDYTDTYPVLGVYTATVTATNAYNWETARTIVRVINDEPVVDTSGLDRIAFEKERVWSATISFYDPNRPDSHRASIDWGDGLVTEPEGLEQHTDGGRLWGSHVYADPGVYTVTVTVRDAYGGVGTGQFAITVLHGLARYCVYAGGEEAGVTIDPQARLDCGWMGPEGGVSLSPSGVGSRSRIEVGEGAVLTGSLVSEGGEAVLGRDARLLGGQLAHEYGVLDTGHVTAGGTITLEERSSVARDVIGRADVELLAESSVGGDVVAAGQVHVDPTATVGGTITPTADVPPIPSITPFDVSIRAGTQDITVPRDGVRTLAPGRYRRLTLERNSTLRLRAGHYVFEGIETEWDVRIEYDLAAGAVTIDVAQSVHWGWYTRMAIVSDAGDASGILYQVAGEQAYLGRGGAYLGTYLAPRACLHLKEEATLVGALYGLKVEVHDRARLIGMPAVQVMASTLTPADVGGVFILP